MVCRPINVRAPRKTTTFPPEKPGGKPWLVPQGTKIVYSVFSMHRREDLWGPDTLVFDPERFLDERARKYLIPNPFIFLPFNAGPRICLGQQFGYNQVSYFMIRFLQSFSGIDFVKTTDPPPKEWRDAEGPKGRDRIRYTVRFSLVVRGQVWMKMTEADESEDS